MSTVRGWSLSVDWSGGGGLTGPLEDVTNLIDRNVVTASWGRPVDDVKLETPSSEMRFDLINRTRTWDRWLSPENTASPIYGKIYPGKDVLLTKTVGGQSALMAETFPTAAGWTTLGGGTATWVATPTEDGNGALRYTAPGSVPTVGVRASTSYSFANRPAGSFNVAFRVQANVTWNDIAALVDWYDKAGNLIGPGRTTVSPIVTSGTWTTVQATGLTPPAGAVALRPRLQIGSTPANTVVVTIDSVTVTAVPADAGKTYTIYAGVLDDLGVDTQAVDRKFSGTVLDAWGRPTEKTLSTTVYQGVRTGDCINVILDQIGWPGGRAIDPGATLIPYWWEEGTSPIEAITRLVNSEGPPAIAYVEAGTFVFRDRHHRVRSAASQPATTTSIAYFTFPTSIADFATAVGCTVAWEPTSMSNQITIAGSPAQSTVRQTIPIGVTAGQTYRATGYIFSSLARTVAATIDWYGPGGPISSNTAASAIPVNAYTLISSTAVAPPGATYAYFGPTLTSPANGLVYLDNVEFEQLNVNITRAQFAITDPPGAGDGTDFRIEKGTFEYDHGLKSIVNTARFSVDQRKPVDIVEVWTSEDPIAGDAGYSTTLFVETSDPVIGAILPTIDSGDLITTLGGQVNTSIDRDSGTKFIITLSWLTPCTVLRIALRGIPVPVARSVQASAVDQGSVSRYRQQISWPVDAPWANAYDAQAIADRVVAIYSDYRPRITFTVVALNDRYTSALLGLRISDRITVRNDLLGFTGDFHIEKLQVSVSGLNIMRVTISAIRAEPLQPANALTFDVAGKGFDQGAFAVVGIDAASTMFVFDSTAQGFERGLFST